MSTPDTPFISRGDGQALFAGADLFLRWMAPDDAATAALWHPDRFPVPAGVMRERIQQQLGDDPTQEAAAQRMIMCRRTDDRPLGSVLFAYENERSCVLRFTHDPNRSLDERARIEAEVMQMSLPFLIEKRNLMKVTTDHMGDHSLVRDTAKALGLRRCYRLREAFLHRGKRYDRVGYEFLNPFWVNLLGLPREMSEDAATRTIPSHAPDLWQSTDPISPRAIVATGQVELRTFEPADTELASQSALRETEDFYPTGPPLRNPWSWGQHMESIAREQPPSELRFALVESATQEHFGTIGVTHLDLFDGRGKATVEIFRPDYRGRGFGGSAHQLLFEVLFGRLGLHMIYAWVSEFNLRSLAATRKRGYREAGYLAWEDLSPTGYCGGFYLDFLASEWRAARR